MAFTSYRLPRRGGAPCRLRLCECAALFAGCRLGRRAFWTLHYRDAIPKENDVSDKIERPFILIGRS